MKAFSKSVVLKVNQQTPHPPESNEGNFTKSRGRMPKSLQLIFCGVFYKIGL